MIITYILRICKISSIIKNDNKIRICVKLTSINNISYKYHSSQIRISRSMPVDILFFLVQNQFMSVDSSNQKSCIPLPLFYIEFCIPCEL